ncbi:DUF4397 domain-containing protein [Cytobacillus dafuensis]|uniref:DUF4397 domain-containing protein n=1 Tax=Cytobacillus dafuensis TaxID=1742359 RepID=A0A5B8Z5G1_CYTDA|nr:DUF4397 domain-containing protein [Cytobacillus dafuensis]QED48312.1 DUF4397 domain-containing protein [Cytobacillus dafuensis]
MSRNRNNLDFFQKAGKYDLLANYYKYSDPNKHIAYYQKHLHYINMATHYLRSNMMSNHQNITDSGKIRFVHASTDTKNVDIYINGIRILRDFPYKEISNYLSIPIGKHQVDIYPAGNMVSTILSRKIKIEHDRHYTFIPTGYVKNIKWIVLEDEPRVPNKETKLRFVHLSPDSPELDIAVKDRDVLFSNVSFRKSTSYLSLSPMIVDLEARISGSSNIVLPLSQIQLKPKRAYSILLIGLADGEPNLEAIIIKG